MSQHGETLTLTGYVRLISDGHYANMGPIHRRAVEHGPDRGLRGRQCAGDPDENRIQPYDCEAMRSVGIEPRDCLLIGLKSAVHFRADYARWRARSSRWIRRGCTTRMSRSWISSACARPMWLLDEVTQLSEAKPHSEMMRAEPATIAERSSRVRPFAFMRVVSRTPPGRGRLVGRRQLVRRAVGIGEEVAEVQRLDVVTSAVHFSRAGILAGPPEASTRHHGDPAGVDAVCLRPNCPAPPGK